MKSLIGLTLVALTLTATAKAQTQGLTPCRWEHSYCHNNFERSDAFEALYRIEGNVDQAHADLRVIEEAVKKNSLNFEPAVGNFIFLLRKVGGAKYSADIQQTFTQLSQYTHGHVQLADITEAFWKIYNIELRIDHTRVGMKKIMALKEQSEDQVKFYQSVELYLNLLRMLGGNTATADVGTALSAIGSYSDRYQLDYLYQTFGEIYHSYAEFEDALASFHLTMNGAKSSEVENAKESYMKVLKLLDDGTDEQM